MYKNKKQFPFVLLLLVAVCCLSRGMERNLWFDEALTLLNFALLPDFGTIYQQYVIPNNQIVHTWILHLFAPFALAQNTPEIQLRLIPATAAIGLITFLYFQFRRQLGAWTLAITLAAFAGSAGFMIYGTALRGYIWGALFVAFALRAGLNYARNGGKIALLIYFLAGLAAVGCAPTNLAGLAAAVLYAMPLLPRRFWRSRRFWVLAVIPPLALTLFYLPIGRQFLGCARLGEGWNNSIGAALHFYGAAGLIFAIPALGAIFGRWNRFSWRWLIPFLPLAGFLLLPTAPFPRVFFPILPIFALLLAEKLRDVEAKFAPLPQAVRGFRHIMFLAVIVWFFVPSHFVPPIDEMTDDYLRPYYMKPEFSPAKVFEDLDGKWQAAPNIFASFNADPWALLFQGALQGMETGKFRFDGPRGPVNELPAGSLLILHQEESPEIYQKRFGRPLIFVRQQGRNTVYQL